MLLSKEVSYSLWLFLLLEERPRSTRFAKLWCSAHPLLSQASFASLVDPSQNHFLRGYQALRLTTSFKVSMSGPSAQPVSSNSSPVCNRESRSCCSCLAAPLMAMPIQAVPPFGRADTAICRDKEPPGSRDEFSRGTGAPSSHARHWQEGAAWSASCSNPAEGGTAKRETTAHSSSRASDPEDLPAQLLDLGEFTKPFL